MRTILLALALLSPSVALAAGPQVEIVLRETAPPLERKAAEEIAACLKRLYAADTSVVTAAAGGKDAIYVNPPSPAAKLNDQAYTLKSTSIGGRPALVISGGRPAAVYWAAAEFQHQLGVRTFLFGDLDPINPKPYSLADWMIEEEAAHPDRGWRLAFEDPIGPQGWSGEELQSLIGQLAKLKFNQLIITVSGSQPFVHLEAEGVVKQTGDLWLGKQLAVSGDTAGRAAFRGAKVLENPDIAAAASYRERTAAGEKLLSQVIDAAKSFQMEVGLVIDPLDLPAEFPVTSVVPVKVLTPDEIKELSEKDRIDYQRRLENYLKIKATNQVIAKAHLLAILKTYPQLNCLYETSLDRQRSGWVAELFSKDADLQKEFSSDKPRSDKPRMHLSQAPEFAQSYRKLWTLPLSGEALPWLPQAIDGRLVDWLENEPRELQHGYAWKSPSVADLDLSAYLLSRTAFGAKLTRESASEALLSSVCGEEVAGRVVKALGLVERASELISGNSPDFAKPAPEMVLKHLANADPPPMWLTQAKESYLNAMNEMYRANTRSRDGGRAFTLYLARRYEFGFEYLNCVEAIKKAGVAKKNGDAALQAAELQKAVESMNNGLAALAAVSRSASDRATIAWLNEYGYRPLVKALEEAEDAQ